MKKIFVPCKITTLVFVLMFTVIQIQAAAATYYSVATGDWTSSATWSLTSGVGGGAGVPVAGDNVVIEGGHNVIVTANAACASITFTATTATSLTINTGILLDVSGAITIPRAGFGVNLIAVGAGNLNAGSIAFTSGGTAVNHKITISSGTVNVSGDITTSSAVASGTIQFTAAGTLNAGAGIMTTPPSLGTLTTVAGCTVNYNGSGPQVVRNVSYAGNLTLSGSGIKTWTRTAIRTIGGNLTINSGTELTTTGTVALTITGATTVSGTLNLGGTVAALITFSGDVTIGNGGLWNETGVALIDYASNLQNNGNYTADAGVHTFSGASKTISGVNTITIPNLSITGTTTNNGTLTVSTTLAGTGTLTNGAAGILNFGGTAITPTLAATAPGNTVNYTGAAQTVKATTYDKLTLSGGNIKTMAATTIINDNFSIASGTKADLGAITTYTTNTLTLAGAGTLSGTWGSSGATDADYKDDTYFVAASTGYITVSAVSCIEPEITSGPDPLDLCEKGSGSFTVVAPGTGLTYQWQYFNIGADAWVNTDTITGVTGHTSATLTFTNTPLAFNGTEFWCVVTAGGCYSYSVIAPLTVNPLPLAAGPISGTYKVLQGATGVVYSVAAITYATEYTWAYSGTGVTINGTGNSVTLDFALSATSGDLTVKGTNSCGNGASALTPILVGTLWVPAAFTVTGGGPYCSSGTGATVGLSGSENGVTYTLYKDAVAQPSTVPGTGAAIPFGPQLAGTYTVKGSNGFTTDMNGSAVITAVAPPTAYAGPNSVAVVGTPYLLSGSTATNYTSLAWTLGTNATGTFSNPNALQPTYTQNNLTAPVILILTVSNGGICPNAVSQVQLTMTAAGDTKRWTGADGNSWEASGNWTPTDGFIPTATTDVTIPATTNKPTINSAVVCKSITIDAGAVLTIAPGESLSVSGALTNNGGTVGLVLQSNASGTGSLLNNSAGVGATVQRYISGNWASALTGWHFISSPVATQAISAFATGNYDFYGWDEVSNLWMNYKDGGFSSWNGGINFNTGQGYMISYESTQTGIYTGTLNVDNHAKSNLTLSNGANYSWHLLGNPFCSAISWNDGNWALSNVAGTAKIWNESGSSYRDINPGGIIPSAQGFMVSVNTATNSITIPAASRTNSNTAWYKSSEIQYLTLIASQQDGKSFQESTILLNPSANAGFDFEYDSRFLEGYAPQFFSVCADEKLSTNSLPVLNTSEIIPFGFIKNQSDSFKIELKENKLDLEVYLKDKKTGTITKLSETPVYLFTSEATDDANRFELSFLDVTGVTKPDSKETFTIYQSKGNINITSQSNVNTEILVTNLVGQVVMRGKTNGNALTTLNAGNLQNGVYVVSLVGNGKKVSKKLVVSK